uniref:Uncharacterized protein n=1 Tax=Hyaloperonospora arabidopsidis (strain Emoy2) TaxID=559515 RepID=M4BC93_HYAAE
MSRRCARYSSGSLYSFVWSLRPMVESATGSTGSRNGHANEWRVRSPCRRATLAWTSGGIGMRGIYLADSLGTVAGFGRKKWERLFGCYSSAMNTQSERRSVEMR